MTDPDVVLTDVGLALLGAYLGRRLGTPAGGGMLRTAGAVVMGGLASAALWGAIFHAWFPAKTATPAGFLIWMLVALSILVVAARLLDLGLSIVAPRLAPTLVLILMAALFQAARTRNVGWSLIAVGFTVSVGAALLQQAKVSIHPVYFDHNALYHVLQGIALVLLYPGFRRAPDASASA